jgi:hypothetical protein
MLACGECAQHAWASLLAIATAAAFGAGCTDQSPVPERLAETARGARAAESASAAAAVLGVVPLGAAPVVAETAFGPEQPTAFCSFAKSDACFLDVINEGNPAHVPPIGRTVPVHLVGWAVDFATGTVPPVIGVELLGSERFYAPAVRVRSRPDVARVLKVPSFIHSGYDVVASLGAVTPGEYTIDVLQVNVRGIALRCETKRKITVE